MGELRDWLPWLSPLVVSGIGWLIRLAFKHFEVTLNKVARDVETIREKLDVQGNRITALEARQSQFITRRHR